MQLRIKLDSIKESMKKKLHVTETLTAKMCMRLSAVNKMY